MLPTVGRLGAALLLVAGAANAQSDIFPLDSDGKFLRWAHNLVVAPSFFNS